MTWVVVDSKTSYVFYGHFETRELADQFCKAASIIKGMMYVIEVTPPTTLVDLMKEKVKEIEELLSSLEVKKKSKDLEPEKEICYHNHGFSHEL